MKRRSRCDGSGDTRQQTDGRAEEVAAERRPSTHAENGPDGRAAAGGGRPGGEASRAPGRWLRLRPGGPPSPASPQSSGGDERRPGGTYGLKQPCGPYQKRTGKEDGVYGADLASRKPR